MSRATLSEADRTAIEAVIEEYRQAVLAADWDRWATTLAETIFLSPPHEPARTGRAAAVEWVHGFPPVKRFVVSIDELDGAGDMAWARGRYELVMAPPDGSVIEDHGHFLEVHCREADGSWPYRQLMFHSAVPLPA